MRTFAATPTRLLLACACAAALAGGMLAAQAARGAEAPYFFAGCSKSFLYSPYPSASRRSTGMKRIDAEFMQ